LAKTIKVNHKGEIRKLKGVPDYLAFVDLVKKKMHIDLESHEMYYIDEDGDEISISNAEDYDECLNVMHPKVPKIHFKMIQKEQEEDFDVHKAFPSIAMTTSTVERPNNLGEEQKEDHHGESEQKVSNISHEGQSKVNPSVAQSTFERIDVSHAGQQTESEPKTTSDEKCTSTKYDGVLINTSSVQTQSISNADAGTDVKSLVTNQDKHMGTEPAITAEKASQLIVAQSNCAIDPISPEVHEVAIEAQVEAEESKVQTEEIGENFDDSIDIEKILSDVVKVQMNDLTPVLIDECKKFVSNFIKEEQKRQFQKYIEEHSCDTCGTRKATECRFSCYDCIAECVSPKGSRISRSNSCNSEKKGSVKEIHENFVSCVDRKRSNSVVSGSSSSSVKSTSRISNLQRSDYGLDKIKDSESSNGKSDVGSESDFKSCGEPEEQKDPVIEDEEIVKDPEEFPEMVKRSVMLEYKPFPEDYINRLKVKWSKPNTNTVHLISQDNDFFNIEFEAINSDITGNTRWPIFSSLRCILPEGAEMENCTQTNKEIRAGVVAKFTAKMKTPKDGKQFVYRFQLEDEYKRLFGEPIDVKVKAINQNVILNVCEDNEEISAFEEPAPHKAYELYPHTIENLEQMGIEMTKENLDVVLKCQGRVEEIMEVIM
jgi:hypothetical protein